MTELFNCLWILFGIAVVSPCFKRTTYILGRNHSIPAFTTWKMNFLSAVGFSVVFSFLCSIHFLQHTIQKPDVFDTASQNVNFGELFVRWVCRQKFSQFRKSHVDILLSPSLSFGYGKHIPFNAKGSRCQHVVFEICRRQIKTWNRSWEVPRNTSLDFKLVCLGEFLVAIHRYQASVVSFIHSVVAYDIIAFFNPIKVLSSYNNNSLTPVNW